MEKLKIVLPKGHLFDSIFKLFLDAGYNIKLNGREYKPYVSDPGLDIKIMKPQNIPKLIELGSHDLGFTGYDWIVETNASVTEILDLKTDPVRLVAAIPDSLSMSTLKNKRIVVASEYETIATTYLDQNGFDYIFLRTYGATEVFPPDDADMIIDNTSTGRTLMENKLKIVDTILSSTTRMIINSNISPNSQKMKKITELKLLFQSILDARDRVMLEMNIPSDKLDTIVPVLPCMQAPTVSSLVGNSGYAIKIAVKKSEIPSLIPKLKAMGARDILEYNFRKVVL
ncbi:MAG: ATP phosphoribosyltransferase [Calditrichia bacterium]